MNVGTKLSALHFVPGQFVDVQGLSKAKGFQGVMKRWGFKGQSKSHGTSLSHRSAGSIGQRKDPGKVFKGKKMAGHMGGEYVTAMSLRVLKIDKQLDLIYVKGSVPGPDGSIIKIRDAIWKRDQFDPYTLPPPFPTADREKIDSSPAELTIKSPEGATDPLAVQYKL
jgi:large subunit ribosomal protein L3